MEAYEKEKYCEDKNKSSDSKINIFEFKNENSSKKLEEILDSL